MGKKPENTILTVPTDEDVSDDFADLVPDGPPSAEPPAEPEVNSPGADDGGMRCALGIERHNGVPVIAWHVGPIILRLTHEQADDLGRRLQAMAVEVRLPSMQTAELPESR